MSLIDLYFEKYGNIIEELYRRPISNIVKERNISSYGYELEIPLVEVYRSMIYDSKRLLELFHVGYDRSGVAELDTPPLLVPIDEEDEKNIRAVFTGLALTGFYLYYTFPIGDRLTGTSYGRHFHVSYRDYPRDRLCIIHRVLPCLKPLLAFKRVENGLLAFRRGVDKYATPTWGPTIRSEDSTSFSMSCINKQYGTYEIRLAETSILETYATAHILYTVYLEPEKYRPYLPASPEEVRRIVLASIGLEDFIHVEEGKYPLFIAFAKILRTCLDILKEYGYNRAVELVRSTALAVLRGRYIINLLELAVPSLIYAFNDVEYIRVLSDLVDPDIRLKILSELSTRSRR